jgi:hypothetical protein
MRVCSYMSDWSPTSLEDGIQILQKHVNIQTMGIGSLLKAFILGSHAADTTQVVLLKDLYRIGVHPHYFKKSHIFCDRIRHLVSPRWCYGQGVRGKGNFCCTFTPTLYSYFMSMISYSLIPDGTEAFTESSSL